MAAFDAFLESISDPAYQRLCWVEGPAALGFEDWWACGERYEIEVIRGQLDRAAEAGVLLVEDLDMLAHVLFGAVAAGVLAMARSDDPARERDRFRTVMLQVMAGWCAMEAFEVTLGRRSRWLGRFHRRFTNRYGDEIGSGDTDPSPPRRRSASWAGPAPPQKRRGAQESS